MLRATMKFGKQEISNTDQGSQFTSDDFIRTLKDNHSIDISMDVKGQCYDNVFVERPLKYEEIYLKKAYGSIAEARRELSCYFEFYNQRRHQGLDDKTSDDVYYTTSRAGSGMRQSGLSL